MTYIVTSKCTRDLNCAAVCPVECIVAGEPEAEWPHVYVDPETCIDCGACVAECQYDAIMAEADVPAELQQDIQPNYDFYKNGPGYSARA